MGPRPVGVSVAVTASNPSHDELVFVVQNGAAIIINHADGSRGWHVAIYHATDFIAGDCRDIIVFQKLIRGCLASAMCYRFIVLENLNLWFDDSSNKGNFILFLHFLIYNKKNVCRDVCRDLRPQPNWLKQLLFI